MSNRKEKETISAAISFVVPKQHVKTVKTALEHSHQLDRASKITPERRKASTSDGAQKVGNSEEQMRIPTTISYLLREDGTDEASRDQDTSWLKARILEDLGITHLYPYISISYRTISGSHPIPECKNPLRKALGEALDALPMPILTTLELTKEALVLAFPESYSVYKPMLLLSHSAFASKPWKRLLASYPIDSDILRPVWKHVAEAIGATHVATNSPIPLQTSTHAEENILRSPVNLKLMHGDFGPSPTSQTLSNPTASDFDRALWVSTTQNGIHQTWAPLYTMFSRGNIREKTRLLQHPSVTTSFDKPSATVDLYAGIGYFAFSFKKGGASNSHDGGNGMKTVLCFELNPWSVEGLRRGAELNGWTSKIFKEQDMPETEKGWEAWQQDVRSEYSTGPREDFWIFQMSNEHALPILNTHLADHLPPIRHINLGLLPTSRLSWRSAVRLLDTDRGGWIHVHENVGINEIDERTKEVQSAFQELLDEYEDKLIKSSYIANRKLHVEHVERVKMYAPGVVHCVFDVHVEGREDVV